MTAVLPHQAIGGVLLVPGNLPIVFAAYLGPIVILVVFGIWGFRLGSKDLGRQFGRRRRIQGARPDADRRPEAGKRATSASWNP